MATQQTITIYQDIKYNYYTDSWECHYYLESPCLGDTPVYDNKLTCRLPDGYELAKSWGGQMQIYSRATGGHCPLVDYCNVGEAPVIIGDGCAFVELAILSSDA